MTEYAGRILVLEGWQIVAEDRSRHLARKHRASDERWTEDLPRIHRHILVDSRSGGDEGAVGFTGKRLTEQPIESDVFSSSRLR